MPCFELAGAIALVDLMIQEKLASSKSDARRLINQRGVKLDGDVIDDVNAEIEINSPKVLRVGKRRFLQLVPKE